MKNSNMISYIVILGIVVTLIFTYVSAVNLFSENISSDSYYSKVSNLGKSEIKNISFSDEKLNITTSNNTKKICVKTTKSTPKLSSMCFKNVVDGQISIAVFSYKKYYIWMVDDSDIISGPISFNLNEKQE